MRNWFYILAIALLLSTACSHSAMTSQPFWDSRDSQKGDKPAKEKERLRDDRVNVWPIFYYQDPSVSLLWPLISADGDAHAFVPIYEYYRPYRELRLIAIHQDFPSFADFRAKDGYNRVFTFVYDRDDHLVAFYPFYIHKLDKHRIIAIPFTWIESDGFWSLPYTNTPSTQGFAGPLFLHHKGHNSSRDYYWFPFPLCGAWSGEGGGFIVFPIVYHGHKTDDSDTNILGPLFHYSQENSDKMAYFLWPLGGAGVDHNVHKNYFVPFWYSSAADNRHKFLSLPYTDVKDGDGRFRNLLGPVYISSEDGDKYYRSVMFPFFHSFNGAERKGHSLMPLYLYSSDAKQNAHFYSFLYSFYSDGTMHNFLGPVYHQSKEGDETDRWAAWPLFHQWDSKAESGGYLFPLGFYNSDSEGHRQIITPVAADCETSESKVTNILGPLYLKWKSKTGNWTYHSLLFPIFHNVDDTGDSSTTKMFLPFFVFHKNAYGWKILSLPLSFGKDGSGYFINMLALLFHHESDSQETYTGLLLPFMACTASKSDDDSLFYVFPLFKKKRENDVSSFGAVLGILLDFDASMKSRSELQNGLWRDARIRTKTVVQYRDVPPTQSRRATFIGQEQLSSRYSALLGMIRFRTMEKLEMRECASTETLHPREFRVDVADLPSTFGAALATTPGDIAATTVLAASFHTDAENRIFPLFYYEDRDGENTNFNILWRLFDSETRQNDDGSSFKRRRVLWKLFHYESSPDSTALDAFPFIAYDNKTDSSRLLLIGGLLGYSRKPTGPRLHFLFIPIPL